MTVLRSLYSDAISVTLVEDTLPPKAPVLGEFSANQDSAVTHGRSKVTSRWDIPTENETIGGEFLGEADGDDQDFETIYAPIKEDSYLVMEVTGYTVSGGETNPSSPIAISDLSVATNDTSDFSVGDWVEILEGSVAELNQIESVDEDAYLNFVYPIRNAYTVGAILREVDVLSKTKDTDYTVNTTTGVVSLIDGQFTATNDVFMSYVVPLNDLEGFKLLRVPGDLPYGSLAKFSDVSADVDVIEVDLEIAAVEEDFEETLASTENGERYSYYLFAFDNEDTPNHSWGSGMMVETIPSIPQNLSAVSADRTVTLFWNLLPETSDSLTDGYNVYRDSGTEFTDATCQQVNSTVIGKATNTFVDGESNTTNRVGEGTLAYPENGESYSYKVESEITSTDWDTGTNNQRDGVAAVLTATKE